MSDEVGPPPAHLMENWQMDAYKKQRKDRLGDILGDYLQDEEMTPEQFFNELKEEMEFWTAYHKKYFDKAVSMQSYILGFRNIELE